MNIQDKNSVTNWGNTDVDIERSGKRIILPNDPSLMPIDDAIEALMRKKADEEQTFTQSEYIESYPLDGAVAFLKAMKQLYGWASPVPTPGFFGPRPPQMKTVKVGPNVDDVMQVPWGSFRIPNVENDITITDAMTPAGKPCLIVYGEIRKREQGIILELVTLTRKILATESIYRGQTISLNVDDEGGLQLNTPPDFFDVSGVTEGDLILNGDIFDQVSVSLFTPMKETALCRQHKIPLKRGILLSGPYGTGKTLAARVAARVAQDNGWTFIMLNKVDGLKAALQFAEQYSPAVVFAEDIDRILSERDDGANDLVNTIDGILSKNSEVITVLTTNHIELIQPVMLRPGRLDAVIDISPPDGDTAQRLIRLYARGLVSVTEDLTEAGEAMAGQIPATIREIVERSKLGMIGRRASFLSGGDLVVAARGMTAHLALLNKQRSEPSAAERLAESLRDVLFDVSDEGGSSEVIDQVKAEALRIRSTSHANTAKLVNLVIEASGAAAGAAKAEVATVHAHLDNATAKVISAVLSA